jgi:hypothetical protein
MPIDKELKSEILLNNIEKTFTKEDSESTGLYQTGNPEASIKIVASMRDYGEVNVLLPVIEELLKDKNYGVSIFADGPGEKILKNKSRFKKIKVEKNILVNIANEVESANMVLVSQSVNSGIDNSLVSTAATEAGIKAVTVAIEDFPGGGSALNNVLSSKNNLLIPDWQCVMNEESKKAVIKARPNLDPKRIVITGLPNFDKINVYEKENTRNEFREKYEVKENENIIVWVGGYGEVDSESLKIFLEGLKNSALENYRLVIRRHPSDERSKEFFDNITTDFYDHLLDTSSESIDVVRQSADLIVTINSTESVKAVCEGTLTLLVIIPEILKQTGEPNFTFLIAEDGSTAVVREKSEMVKTLKKVFNDEKFKNGLNEKMKKWKVDGKATERVVALIKNKAQNNQ